MIRRPLRPLARILRARAEGKDPNLVEAEERAARLAARHRAERVKAETRLLLLGVVFILGFSTVAGRMALLSAAVPVEPRGGIPGDPIHTQRADIVDRNGAVLATNIVTASLYAQPAQMIDPRAAADGLAGIFPDLDAGELYAPADRRAEVPLDRAHHLARAAPAGARPRRAGACSSARARRGSIRTARWRRMCSAARASGARGCTRPR